MSLTFKNPETTIVGAGIGGLSAAIALQQIGLRVKVFEKAPGLKETGAGIVLAANAIKVLEKLGVAEEIRLAGSPVKKENPAAMRIRNQLLRMAPDKLKIKRLDWVLGYEA